MRIDKLIEKLQKIESKYGLIDVAFYDFEWGELRKIQPHVYKKDEMIKVALNDDNISFVMGEMLD